jgi:dolichol kinase
MLKVADKIKNTKKRINSLDFDAHWYRRVFHAFGASFLYYYMLPDVSWVNILKFYIPPIIVVFAITLEALRLKGLISSDHFFGLRFYEKKRVGSYVFFAVAILILLRFFPQQIAIPCILCACLADPIIGEIRKRYGARYVYLPGFFICMLFFLISWYKADIRLMIIVSIIGGFSATFAETKKLWWLDDDFMIQMVPAVLILIIWISLPYFGFSYPDLIIYPAEMPW